MDDRRNYYRVLHLQPDAPIELVRVNYRTLMQKLGQHPDLGGEGWSAAHLNAAYRTLSDPARRAAYDRELLSRYEIEVIAQGRPKARPRKGGASKDAGANRRNFYRVLQVQHDAPIEIIERSHRALRAATPADCGLLDEALALLSDRGKRAAYDRLLEVCEHQDALARLALATGPDDWEPLILSYCAFCKTPHARPEDDAEARCGECASPLFPPPASLRGLARRAVARVLRDDPIQLFTNWPMNGIPGRLTDLSPTGLRCETRAHLDEDDVVKVSSPAFDAVGSVAHAQREAETTSAGLRFLTVRFQQATGNFQSIKA